MNERFTLEITTWTVIKLIGIVLAIYFLYFIKDVLALLFIVLILVATFSPIVAKWSKSIKRAPAVLAILLLFLIVILGTIYLIIPPLVKETSLFAQNVPGYMEKYPVLKSFAPNISKNLSSITSGIGGATQGFVSLSANIFGGVFSFIIALVLFVYLLLDEKAYKKILIDLMPENSREKIISVLKKIGNTLGRWFRGQMLLGLIIGVIDFVGLLLLGVPYAIVVAVFSGLMEIIPTIGPIISGVFAALIALTVSPLKALLVIILYLIVQQLENSLIVPKIMQKAVGLSPVIIIFSILIGAKLLGIIGILLAVPISATISVLIKEWPMIKSLFADEK